jgi:hypothetical protein
MEIQYLILLFQVVTGLIVVIGGWRVKHELELERDRFRQDFEERWKALDRIDKFRLAALDSKPEAHQKAFALARKMFFTRHDESAKSTVRKEIDKFWDERVLYLTENARQALWEAVHNYDFYKIFLDAWKIEPKDEKRNEVLQKAFGSIKKLQSIWMSITDSEYLGKGEYLSDESITPYGVNEKAIDKRSLKNNE